MLPYMFINKQLPFISLNIFRSVALIILAITLVHNFKPPSNINVNNTCNINSHINKKLTSKFHINYSSMEPVLFEKLQKLNYHTLFSELPPFSNLILPKLH